MSSLENCLISERPPRGQGALLNELKLLKLVAGNFRTELYSVLEKLAGVASLDKETGQPSVSVSEQTATQIVENPRHFTSSSSSIRAPGGELLVLFYEKFSYSG
jgi:hypothetical protein